MKSIIHTTVESFLRAMKDTHVERKVTIPVLSYAKISFARIIGTDLDLSTTANYDAVTSGPCEFLIPYRQTLDALNGEKGALVIEHEPGERMLPQVRHIHADAGCSYTPETGWSCKRVDREIDEEASEKEAARETEAGEEQYNPGTVKLTIGELTFRLNSFTLRNYPVTPDVVSGTSVQIEAKRFAEMLERTRFAISREESRYTLNGAMFEVSSGMARMVATDGHRLSLYQFEAQAMQTVKALFPSGAIAWLDARAGKDDAVITIGENEIAVTLGTRRLITRKLSGQFPNYMAVMPNKFNASVLFPAPDKLAKNLARVAKCADERSNAVSWAFDPTGGMIRANSTERGEASAKVDCSVTFAEQEPKTNEETGEPIEAAKDLCIGFNATYAQEFLKLAKDEPVTLSLRDSQSAGLFSVGDNWKYVVMPMRM